MSDETFGDRLRTLRLRLKLSQEGMAELLKITQHTYSNYETNKRSPPAKILNHLKHIPDLDMNWLIFGDASSSTRARSKDPEMKDFFYWLNKLPIVRHYALAAFEDVKFKHPGMFKKAGADEGETAGKKIKNE